MTEIIRPEWGTVVLPWEYDIIEQFNRATRISNTTKDMYVGYDVGKVVGLLRDWVEAREIIESLVGIGRKDHSNHKYDEIYEHAKHWLDLQNRSE